MRTLHHKLSAATVALAIMPLAVIGAMNSSTVLLTGLAAITVMLAAVLFALAATEVIKEKKWF